MTAPTIEGRTLLFKERGEPMGPRISGIISTHNRFNLLGWSVRSLMRQDLPANQYEIIVVDNGSQDATKQVVMDLARESVTPLRYVQEPAVGLSHARNAGWRIARGDVVAFLDDDAEAEPDWLRRLLEVYERHPEAAAVGGRVDLVWPGARPSWLHPSLDAMYTATDWGPEIRVMREDECAPGCNCSYRRELIDLLGGFDVRLGRQGKSLWANEDSEMAWRLRHRLGRPLYCSPLAVVHHQVQARRLNRGYLLSHEFWSAASRARWEAEQGGAGPTFRRALGQCARTPAHLMRAALYTLSSQPATGFLWTVQMARTVGYLFGLAGLVVPNSRAGNGTHGLASRGKPSVG